MAGVAADAEGSLLMDRRYAVERPAAARGVGEPRIARAHEVVNGRSYRFLRIRIRRRIVKPRAQLVLGMIGADAHIVIACLRENLGGEFVAGKRLNFMEHSDRILTLRVLLGLAVVHAEYRNIDGQIVAVHQLELKEDQLRSSAVEVEPIPVFGARVIRILFASNT